MRVVKVSSSLMIRNLPQLTPYQISVMLDLSSKYQALFIKVMEGRLQRMLSFTSIIQIRKESTQKKEMRRDGQKVTDTLGDGSKPIIRGAIRSIL